MAGPNASTTDSVEEDLAALLRLSEALVDSSDAKSLLRAVAEQVAERLQGDRGTVVLLDRQTGAGYVLAASDDPGLGHVPINLHVYPEINEVARTGEALLVDDVDREPLFDSVRERLRGKGLGSTILFPIRVDRQVHAVLLIRNSQPRKEPLLPREIRFGQIVANATGVALRNERMLDAVRERQQRFLSVEARLRRQLEQFRKFERIFEMAGDGMMLVDTSGAIHYANHAALTILGFEKSALTHIRLHDLVSIQEQELLETLFAGVRENNHCQNLNLSVLKADGGHAILSMTTSALEEHRDLAEGPQAAIISFRDVTRHQAMEEELRTTKDFLVNLIESSVDALVVVDNEGRIVVFNRAAEQLTGYSKEEAFSLGLAALISSDLSEGIQRRLSDSSEGTLDGFQGEIVSSGGQEIPVNFAVSSVLDHGRRVATMYILADLRERLSMASALEQAQKKLAQSERQEAVVELAGAAAHELNQPLAAIMGHVELMLLRVPQGTPGTQSLPKVLSEVERMASIVRNLGRLTRYQTKPYLGETDILDLHAASHEEDSHEI